MMGKSKIIIIVGILLFSTIAGFQIIENVEADDTGGIILDDTFVDEKNKDNNYGSDPDIGISNNTITGIKHVYQKYNISNIMTGSTINEAKLKIYISYNTGINSLSLSTINNVSWDESLVTWNNMPDSTTSTFISAVDISSNPTGWIEWDVTDSIQDSLSIGFISYKIYTEDKADLYINSKENAENKPELVINYTSPPEFCANFTKDINGLNVCFNDNSTPGPGNTITSWLWDFGDSCNSYEQNPNHIYLDDGTYEVTLNVTNSDNKKSNTTISITITNAPPDADFTWNPEFPTIGEYFELTDLTDDPEDKIVNYTWDMGNGDFCYVLNPTYCFTEFDNYNVTLTVEDDKGLTDITTPKKIITKIEETDTINASENQTYQNNEYDFYISNKNVTSPTEIYLKKYAGNPTEKDLGDRIHTAGSFIDIEIENWSVFNPSDVEIRIYYTQQDLDNADIELTEEGLDGIYYFNETSETWHKYENTGVETAYDQYGYEGYCWAIIDHLTPIVIAGEINKKPEVTNLFVFPDSIAEGEKVTFEGEGTDSDGDITAYEWTSDIDGVISNSQSFEKDDLSIGIHTISFKVQDDEGLWSDESKMQVEIYRIVTNDPSPPSTNDPFIFPDSTDDTDDSNAPVADIGGPYEGIAGALVYFDGSKSTDDTGIVSYQWDYGDGSDGYGETPSHKYSKPGEYTVTLTVKDLDGNINTATTKVTVTEAPNNPPEKPIITGQISGKINTEYDYEIVAIDPDENKIRYHVDWDDEKTDTTDMVDSNSKKILSHSWIEPGLYHVKVYSEDEKDAISKTEEIIVRIDINIEFINGEINGFLVDYNKDGTYTEYFDNDTLKENKVVKQTDGSYLIDNDDDGNWDYVYNADGVLTAYENPEGENKGLEGTIGATTTDGGGANTMVVVSAVALIVILGAVGFLGYRNQEYVKKYYNKADKQIHKTIKKLMKNKK